MDWVRIHIPTHIRGKACAASSLEGIGAWLLCLSYCYEKENGGRIKDAATWKDRQLQQEIGISRAEILAANGLVNVEFDDLVAVGYQPCAEINKESVLETLFDVSEYLLPEETKLPIDPPKESIPVVTPSMLAELWNEYSGVLPKVLTTHKLSGTRDAHARKRLIEVPDLARWKRAIKAMSLSDFCTGKQSRSGLHAKWVASFDFLIRPNTLFRVEEGSYGCDITKSNEPEVTYDMPEVFRYLMDGELWEGYLCGEKAKSQQGIWDATFPPHRMKCHEAIKEAFVEVSGRIVSGKPISKNVKSWFDSFVHGRVSSITISAVPGLAAIGIDLNREGLKIEDTMNLSGLKLTDEGGNPL